ncbi:MAG: hypothetical protein JO004_07140 [Methylobacteriaceae bacterium]|nr:hypothetical protein [Methylobacteriaceae bacterium]
MNANPVEPAPLRSATPAITIHLQVEFFRNTIGTNDKQQPASRRYVSDHANGVRATAGQSDLPDF